MRLLAGASHYDTLFQLVALFIPQQAAKCKKK
jgi:hypothetical protein